MKYLLSLRNPLALALLFAAASGLHSVRAQAPAPRADLVLMENSPTSLSLSYTGPDASPGLFTVTPGAASDTWTITVSQTMGPVFFNDFSNGWIEPENPLSVNVVQHSTLSDSDLIFVRSDAFAGGTTSPDNTAFLVGSDSGVPIFLTFHDVAATAETQGAPDKASALGLLGLSAIALFLIKRARFA